VGRTLTLRRLSYMTSVPAPGRPRWTEARSRTADALARAGLPLLMCRLMDDLRSLTHRTVEGPTDSRVQATRSRDRQRTWRGGHHGSALFAASNQRKGGRGCDFGPRRPTWRLSRIRLEDDALAQLHREIWARVDGRYVHDVAKAHIEAAEKNGPRWRASMIDEEPRAPDNLRWLTPPRPRLDYKRRPRGTRTHNPRIKSAIVPAISDIFRRQRLRCRPRQPTATPLIAASSCHEWCHAKPPPLDRTGWEAPKN
jgi:hypothetical protein